MVNYIFKLLLVSVNLQLLHCLMENGNKHVKKNTETCM